MESRNRVYKLEDYSRGAQFLRNDLLNNYEIILALEANVPGVPRDVFVCENDEILGVMNVDRFRPGWVWVSVEALTIDAARSLLEQLPSGEELNFLIHREWMKPLVREMFGVEFTGKRFDYTVDQERFRPIIEHDVRELGKDDAEMLERYPDARGKAPRLIDFLRWQSEGRNIRLFGAISNGELTAHATMDSDIPGIWGVHPFTLEEYRGKGYGKSTMSVATQAALDIGYTIYYDATQNNPAAMRIAERLGYFVYQEIAWGSGFMLNYKEP